MSATVPELKRKRRPGGGRKPIDPQGAVIAPVRFTRDEWEAINRAGKRFGLKRSPLIRRAVKYWLGFSQYPEDHVALLTCLITILIKKIEAQTRRRWIQDAATGAAVREEIGYLIECFAPTAKEPRVVSPEFRQITSSLIAITAELAGHPQLAPALSENKDWEVLAMIAKELGPALRRKFHAVVTITEIPAAPKERQRR
jgi:hypothetical protein